MKTIFWILFLVIYITVVVVRLDSTQKHHLHEGTRIAFEDPVFMSDPDRRITNISRLDDIYYYFSKAFPQSFQTKNMDGEEKLYVNKSKNYLVGHNVKRGTYRITLRLCDLTDNDTEFDVFEKEVREISNFNPQRVSIYGEMKEDFVGKESSIYYEYESLGGYNNAGGYVTYFPNEDKALREKIFKFLSDGLINKALNSIAIDLVSYNGESNSFVYSAFVLYFRAGGEVEYSNFIYPFTLQLFDTPG
jgi:hypothetical protein